MYIHYTNQGNLRQLTYVKDTTGPDVSQYVTPFPVFKHM